MIKRIMSSILIVSMAITPVTSFAASYSFDEAYDVVMENSLDVPVEVRGCACCVVVHQLPLG